MSVGGAGAVPVTDEHVEIANALRDEAQSKAQASGWNGIFAEFVVEEVLQQIVAGKNYFIKARVGGGKAVHMRVYADFSGGRTLNAVKLVEHTAALAYFESEL